MAPSCQGWCLLLLLLLPDVSSFHSMSSPARSLRWTTKVEATSYDGDDARRRAFLSSISALTGLVAAHESAAAIDVSGLRKEPASASSSSIGGSSSIAARVKEATDAAANNAPAADSVVAASASSVAEDTSSLVARNVARVGEATITAGTPLFPSKYAATLVPPKGSKYKALSVEFAFPFDWLQLDRALGGIQFVDQRNGDKLYVLRAPLPAETSLATAPKQYFGDAVFAPSGFLTSGNEVDEYKMINKESGEARSQMVLCGENIEGVCAVSRRRLAAKFSTTTGNGLVVPRRMLIDAYEIDNFCFMLVTSTNQVNFEKAGAGGGSSPERLTAEAIADSFRLVGVV